MKSSNKKVDVSVAQIRIYKRLMPDLKVLAAAKGWSLVECSSILLAEALNSRVVNQKKVNAILSKKTR